MAPISEWPDGLFSALVAAVVSLIGFGLKELYDQRRKRQEEARQAQRAAQETQRQAARTLADFGRLLTESDAIVKAHFELRERLAVSLPQPMVPNETYNARFARLYDDFTPPQTALFRLLRSNTANSMRIQNQLLLDWADRYSAYTLFGEGPEEQAFDEQLRQLRLHLRTWRDKFQASFEADPRQSLVYLHDEDQHGKPFPKQLSAATAALLAKHPA
ncbi:hypothetical protein J0X19_19240 [Hymenobacter sp. BT186]|uniref:DUF4760 domain-containing protein n=1 Tax=Hymenobacter telluris TaxID=2816474 RepID=A0A939EYD6_9BACT|nr:hypothetical protein [Hymenobacter telluris]MBO0360104.1 hypothetical protein [Hymenobacter telluris]MBW3376131.1 hypothetical protein [Hymenobacter norwichensis]